ncbi:hypothetical protein ABB37_02275 [Leptomonas pyrrhocoris]|uniref:RanBP2-type domain-containing protein n=1 Tax=Leptomonas pyrrhocoris TaxID=157538 RepID=A0A0M9G7M9_LEPPY|nr:hypothetical protein ABB37_02275 [Leptomonas pyrrhocoris]KPA84223.1 hypothetical protein ABB37_02275 [Leptomonas pyrrhocoris]|eukprot:XP_015662662.1 hypothetical protein ABB37_02275 [Leptomonas pyrrhocoris]
MWKPHALTASIAHSSRQVRRPLTSRVWSPHISTPSSPSALLCDAEAPNRDAPALVISSAPSIVHVDQVESGGAAVASHLFNLLQLQLRASLMSAHPVDSMTAQNHSARHTRLISSSALRSVAPLHAAQQRMMLRQLRSEVHSLGNLLVSHHQRQHRLGPRSSQRDSKLQVSATQRASHRVRSSSSLKSRETRIPVQLIPLPTDAEQTWVQPLQLDVVQQVLSQLTLAERLYHVLLGGDGSSGRTWQTSSVPAQGQSASPSRASKSSHRVDFSTHGEAQLFFQECTRVVASLAALRAPHESDAQPLAYLAHVLQTSAAAGAPVPVATLIAAVGKIQDESSERLPKGNSVKSSACDGPSSSEPLFNWCSCVPWLLHRYAVALSGAEDNVDWPAASAWMTAAADRVCATQANELLYLSSASSGGPSSTASPRPAILKDTSAGMFGPWQRVLDRERNEAAPACSGNAVPLKSANTTTPFAGGDDQLWSWLAERGQPGRQEVEKDSRDGSLRPYWKVVMREISRSGAQAAAMLMSIVLSRNTEEERQHAGGRTGTTPPSNTKPQRQHHAPSTSTATLLQDLQFHAIGSYVSLRRMTSSLQRHRRLVPLLELHLLVSGYPQHREGEPRQDEGSGGRTSPAADDAKVSKKALTTPRNHGKLEAPMRNEMLAAAHRRHRVLTGELMGVYAGHNQKHHRNSHHHHHPIASYCQQAHQAGAMLWREVALLDAYTLITVGHVSEHAVDVAALDKPSALQQLAWLQQECLQHLRTLEKPSQKKTHIKRPESAASFVARPDVNVRTGSYALSSARTQVLLSSLTPRTRATLVEKLRESLRLSAKVLARWGEAEMICKLYQSYPGMGASWEVGRALLQCGHYEVAVEVLQSLLETSPAAGRGSSSAASLLSSSAVAMRQLLLEAMQGAASALVAQQHCEQQQEEEQKHELPSTSSPFAATLPSLDDALADASREPRAAQENTTKDSASVSENEVDAPLPAELRAQVHSLYTHSASLPVPLPMCLHAVIQGLTEALPLTKNAFGAPSDEQLRKAAVLCTYALRCHLAEQPARGLLGKTVELWVSCVAPYLCRRRGSQVSTARSSTSLCSPRLSTTDRYLREVSLRLLYGYPHVPVARLLLTRLLHEWSIMTATTLALSSTADASAISGTASRSGHEERAALTVQWMLRHLFRYAGRTDLRNDELQRAYPVCTPDAAIAEDNSECTRWWNADFTERYTQDTLRLMPRIALENLAELLSEDNGRGKVGGLQHVLDRVQVALHRRVSADGTQHQPWQCITCYLWNGRYTSECRRCHTLATSLLQCRSCGFFTSSAGYRASHGLSCEVCGTVLVALTGANAPTRNGEAIRRTPQEVPAFDIPQSMEDANSASLNSSPEAVDQDQRTETQSTPLTPSASRGEQTPVGAATVIGSGRPARLFRDSPHVLCVVPLRPWSCAHCRTVNEAQHVFFCRGCGRPAPATDTTTHAAVSAVSQPCGCCGHVPKTMEGRLLPWCERCGALHERVQRVFTAASAASTTTSAQSGAAMPALPVEGGERGSGTCGPLRLPTLWWCGECAVSLNPWARTHCSLCGAGRPAGGLASALPHASDSASASPSTNASSSLLDDIRQLELGPNAAVPFITVPWSMQRCGGCRALNRVGTHRCWKCGAAQSWPASLRQTISTQWQYWLTQVTHAVTVTGGARSEPEGTGSTASLASQNTASASAPLLLLARTEHWICLRDGCLHLNCTDVAQHTGELGERGSALLVRCAACHTPRRRAEVFNPFHDRLCWRKAGNADKKVPLSPAHAVVGALILPRAAPLLTNPLVGAPTTSSLSDSAARPVRVLHRARVASAATPACACCGALEQEEEGSAPTSSSSSTLPCPPPTPLRPLFWVHMCKKCGHCSWGPSCVAFKAEASAADSSSSATPRGLLPGEEALALRLLLRSLAQSVQQALALQAERKGRSGSGVAKSSSSHVDHTNSYESSSSRGGTPLMDWAWFSRHVLSAVQLFTCSSSSSKVSSAKESIDVKAEGDAARCTLQTEEEVARRHDALLPWCGCDVASAEQLCSSEPRVAVLSDTAGTVHSAMMEVCEVLEGICGLVELRVSEVAAVTARRRPSPSPPTVPLCLEDAWTRRLLLAALDLIDVVNRSTVCDEVGFATLRRLCRLLRPHELDHIDTETKWRYLQDMKLSRSSILHGCVRCEHCLRNHMPGRQCSAL